MTTTRASSPVPLCAPPRRAPRGELVRLPGDHYAAFGEAHEATLDAEIAFLRAHVLEPGATSPGAASAIALA